MEILFFICIAVVSRLIPHLPNMTAVGAMALFTGAKYSLRKSFFITFAAMLCTDVLLGFHPVMWATYGSFFITILLGRLIGRQNNWKFIGVVTLVSSLQFFILTNFAVWFTGYWYSKTLTGLIECYVMALPFLRTSLLGDVFYTTVFFSAYEIVRKYNPKYQVNLLNKYIRK